MRLRRSAQGEAMTPDPKSLAVLLDAARACYGDDSEQVRWLLHPEAVRELLHAASAPVDDFSEYRACLACSEPPHMAHLQGCRIAAAWRDLADPRGAADIERAHEEALAQARSHGRRFATTFRGQAAMVEVQPNGDHLVRLVES